MTRRRRPAGMFLGAVVATVGIAAIVAAGGGDGPGPPAGAAPEAARRQAHHGVCQAQAEAEAGRTSAAALAFVDRAHQPLHGLAAATAELDRALAAELLEQKNRVEQDLDGPLDRLAVDLADLATLTGRAVAVVDGRDPGRCGARGSPE